MALQRSNIVITFSQGVDTFNDPNQIQIGKFQSLQNIQFIKPNEGIQGALKKRFGTQMLPIISGSNTALSVFKNSLVAFGSNNIQNYSAGASQWVSSGQAYPLKLETLSLIRNSFSQSTVDAAVSSSGMICLVFNGGTGDVTISSGAYKYAICDLATGQTIIQPTNVSNSSGAMVYAPRVFNFDASGNFVILTSAQQPGRASSQFSLSYQTIPFSNISTISSPTVISSNCFFSFQGGYDGVVASNTLFLGWVSGNSAANGASATTLSKNFTIGTISAIASASGANQTSVIAMTADTSGSTTIWASVIGNLCGSASVVAINTNLNPIFSSLHFSIGSGSQGIVNTTILAGNGKADVYFEGAKSYSYDSNISTNIVTKASVLQNATFIAENQVVRGQGLASQAFYLNSLSCFISTYQSKNQSTYFLMNSSGYVLSRFAYQNAAGPQSSTSIALTPLLPSCFTIGSSASVPYLIQDLIEPVNKGTNLPAGTNTSGVYSQLGINWAKFTSDQSFLRSSELSSNLMFNGGNLWGYDGFQTAENNFFLYPDNIEAQSAGATGSLSQQTYFYVATYEWTDNQGNIYRSAPSIPVQSVVGTGTALVAIFVPTLRTSYKGFPYSGINNPTRISLYRWSTAQQIYYLLGTKPQSGGNIFLDALEFVDSSTDASIIGNQILYTTGGIVEDISGPASIDMTVFDSRLWLIDAEDTNLLWFSKQVIENTPVEMSDLFTLFIPPNIGTQGVTGGCQCLFPMDDKLVIFKRNSIFYINGTGPDNTGASNQYSQPILINATVGSQNKPSLVMTQVGIFFQSDVGIWLLGRDLSMKYIGQAVEQFNASVVLSAIQPNGTTEVRFSLNTGEVLIYDYLVDQWAISYGLTNVSSTLYQNAYTYVNSSAQISQEVVGQYSDWMATGSAISMSFTTGWINLAGILGFERLYEMFLLSKFKTPHTLNVSLAYDYNPNIVQTAVINPTNISSASNFIERWQINPVRQKCQSFQMTITEVSSSTAGAGVVITGIDLVVGLKKGYPRNIAAVHRTT